MKVIGHRGARGLAPENTIAALQKGLEHHADELEFDVRVTKDKVVILQHDPYITDPSGDRLAVKDYTYEELKAHKSQLCTLEEALRTIGHPVPLQIEVKPNEPTEPIVAVIGIFLETEGWLPEHFLLGSFSQNTLLKLQTALPQIEKVVIQRWSSIRAMQRARQLGTKRISLSQRWLWWPVVQNLSLQDYKVAVYTVNNPGQIKRWTRYGMYAVITDYPDRFESK
jgi:glycerophosphoryl diester phosphodiesterase